MALPRILKSWSKAGPIGATPRYSLASIYARTGRPQEAAKDLLVVLQGEPDHYRANLLLGRMLFLNGTFADALALPGKKPPASSPKSVEAHQFLSEAYAKTRPARKTPPASTPQPTASNPPPLPKFRLRFTLFTRQDGKHEQLTQTVRTGVVSP